MDLYVKGQIEKLAETMKLENAKILERLDQIEKRLHVIEYKINPEPRTPGIFLSDPHPSGRGFFGC